MNVRDDDSDTMPEVNVVPLIDVIFAILTFFILASLFLSRSEGLPVNLPSAQTSTQQNQLKNSKLTVTISPGGALALDRKSVVINRLADRVKTAMGSKPEVLVVINADTKVEHGQVVAVMDQLRSVRGVKLGSATKKKLN
jgi:biopolymer transport protein ExbD